MFTCVFPEDHCAPGAVLPGHSSQLAAEELLLRGGAAEEPRHRYRGHLLEGLFTQTVGLCTVPSAFSCPLAEMKGKSKTGNTVRHLICLVRSLLL